MGGDGQALTNSRKLLNNSKQFSSSSTNGTETAERIQFGNQQLKWKVCSISLDPLEEPIVFDLGGALYSQTSVVEYLLRRNRGDSTAVKSDVFPLKKLSDVREIVNEIEWGGVKCPLTGYVTTSGVHSFDGFWECGHVISSSKTPKDQGGNSFSVVCPLCGVKSVRVRLNVPSEEEIKQRKILSQHIRSLRKRSRAD